MTRTDTQRSSCPKALKNDRGTLGTCSHKNTPNTSERPWVSGLHASDLVQALHSAVGN